VSEPFLYQQADGIARITLNRPDVLNAITFEVYEALRDRFALLAADTSVRVVILTGAGRAFCTGGDVREIIGRLQGRSEEELLSFTRLTCEVILRMREAPQIIIASLNGVTAGAGAALALASDFRIASESARIAFLFVKVGLSGADMGAAHLLPRLLGTARATELLMCGDFVDAATAGRWGLFNRVVAPDALREETESWAASLAAGPTLGLQMTKKILNQSLGFDLREALEVEARAQAICMGHPDFAIAYEAFKMKKPPRFGGSGGGQP